MLMMLPRLFCQTRYECVCFRSGYQRLTNKDHVHARETVPAALYQKLMDLMMVFALLGTPSLAQGYHLSPTEQPRSGTALSLDTLTWLRHMVHRRCDAIFIARML